jgi:aspartate aminotransferase-like enzyme
LPEWINGRSFIEKMDKDHGISVGGGLGKFAGRIFRVGPTGEAQLLPQNVAALLRAIKSVLQEFKRV